MRVFALALLAAACNGTVEVLPCLPADGGPNACPAVGPPQRFDAAGPCTAAMLAPELRYGLCSCNDLTLHGTLLTNTVGTRGATESRAAAVGVNGDATFHDRATIGGALVAAKGVDAAHLELSETLRSGGPLSSSDARLAGDAYVAGSVSGPVLVTGTLHVPEGAAVPAEVRAGAVVREDVDVADPCGCSGIVDVAAIADGRAADNDDALVGLSPGAFAAVTEDAELELPSGQFYLDRVDSEPDVDLTLRVLGHALLVVGGDLRLGGSLRVNFAPGASLDLVVRGDVSMSGGSLGAPGAAERVRVWLGSTVLQTIDDVRVDALVYAPATVVSTGSSLTLTGALLCRALAAASDVTVHFPRNALSAGEICGADDVPAVE